MRLLLAFAMIFFGTLLAAGLLALGAPRPGWMRHETPRAQGAVLAAAPAGHAPAAMRQGR